MPVFAVPPFHINIGAQLVGCFCNLMLFTLELVAGYAYFHSSRKKKDRNFVVGLVILNLVLDAIATFTICLGVFLMFVVFWGHERLAASTGDWLCVVWILTNAFTALTVQTFMVHRYWKLSPTHLILMPIVLMMLLRLAVSLHLAVETVINYKLVTEKSKDVEDVTLTLAASVATDILINIALVCRLHRARTCVKATQHIVTRIIMIAIITGSITSIWSLIVIITYVIHRTSAVSIGFAFVLGRIYTLSMLFTLLNRDMIANDPWLHIIFSSTVVCQQMPSTTSQSSLPTTQSVETPRTASDEMTFALPEETRSPDHSNTKFLTSSHSTPEISSSHSPQIATSAVQTASGHSCPYTHRHSSPLDHQYNH